MKFIYLIILFAAIQFPQPTFGNDTENDSTQCLPEMIVDDIVLATHTLNYAGNEIISLEHYNLLHIGTVLGVTFLSSFADKPLRTQFSDIERTYSTDKIASYANEYGNLLVPAALTGGLYFGGLLFKNNEIRTTGRILGEALIIGGIINSAGKLIIGRARPYLNEGNGTFRPFHWGDERWSFPSGHTTVAFTVSGVLSARIKRWWASAALYSIATCTGLTRIYYDKHWFSDVVMGAILGTFASRIALNAEESRSGRTKEKTAGWYLSPTPQGLALTFNF